MKFHILPLYLLFLVAGMLYGADDAIYRSDYVPPADDKLSLRGYPEKPFYKIGETIRYTIVLEQNGKPIPDVFISAGNVVGEDRIKREFNDSAPNPRTLEIAAMMIPGQIRISDFCAQKMIAGKMEQIKLPTGVHWILGGVMVEPENIKATTTVPEDFDEFWKLQLEQLAAVEMKVLEKEMVEDCGIGMVYDLKISCIDNTPVSGYLFVPKNSTMKSLPAEISFLGYGVNGVSRKDVVFKCSVTEPPYSARRTALTSLNTKLS